MNLIGKRILVTGCAGFIGFHLSKILVAEGSIVFGVDSLSDYYDINLKHDRLNILKNNNNFHFKKSDISDERIVKTDIAEFKPEVVVHLAAQAGVRYSIENPKAYFQSNLEGTFNLINSIKNIGISHFLMASTSSVYGANKSLPFKEIEKCDLQMSFYAATKKAAENITHSYSHLHDIPVTMFRFFTVYGPWGRPDMALFKFTKAILAEQPIDVYNNGNMKRDFTYIDDLTHSIVALIHKPPIANKKVTDTDSVSTIAPWRVVNIGKGKEQSLMYYIEMLEKELGKKAVKNFMPMQQGDVISTKASCQLLWSLIGYVPNTDIRIGVKKFVEWYLSYFQKANI